MAIIRPRLNPNVPASMLKALTISVFLTDKSGRFIYVCDSFDPIFGLSRAEILAYTHILALMPELNPDVLTTPTEIANLDVGITAQNGAVKTVSVDIKPVVIETGRLLFSIRELTPRRNERAALQISREKFQTLINAVDDSLLLMKKDGEILIANQKLGERLQRSAAELRGQKVYDLIDPEVARTRQHQINRVFESGQPAIFVDQRIGLDFENRVFPVFDENQNVPAVAIFGRDITDLHHAEQELQKKHAELERLNAQLINDANELERRVQERTEQYETIINLTADREIRMAGLKNVIKNLRKQIIEAGMEPVDNDPLIRA